MPQQPKNLPRSLELAQSCFANWRSTRSKRVLSAELWDIAIEQALEFGCSQTARALRLNPQCLRQQVDRAQAQQSPKSKSAAAPAPPKFMSIDPLSHISVATESTAEFKSKNGTSLTITWSEDKLPFDLILLAEKLLGAQA
jgi:hypothetical protein